ncbi:hypothetical protein ERICI_03134 [Paenibacillus larvae subsp. larvae]|uniref:Uncharacterized protein n=2 Tax=Paenibacillus larvae subsp. larvae TaxID=147375 RepID=V9W9N6_9BACL|nr:hypothetical protein ERIC2_c31241 [Paenibacillus larvae subsp. larvae DSM 25430]AVF22920.1 hypothetical protein ERICI_03134 [Paenibacillus larvae subsp. larvae]ETK26424.1 hypothetical protein ERIC1_2c06240 [Paenibacillus larvae subsp. larvae DSM 25719]AVF28058.1 hypothetical protein ERICIII_03973 [Paenibacillus larvae subsp. larvae]AVF32561.1 hypothetical protein ERICIV_03716 [Paenibacillus larvae subsp. larvae]
MIGGRLMTREKAKPFIYALGAMVLTFSLLFVYNFMAGA